MGGRRRRHCRGTGKEELGSRDREEVGPWSLTASSGDSRSRKLRGLTEDRTELDSNWREIHSLRVFIARNCCVRKRATEEQPQMSSYPWLHESKPARIDPFL